jgi:hypothetical protein
MAPIWIRLYRNHLVCTYTLGAIRGRKKTTLFLINKWKTLAWMHHFTERRIGPIKVVELRHFLLKCLYQVKRVSGHVYVCLGYQLCFCFYEIPSGFWNYSDNVEFFVSHFILTYYWKCFYLSVYSQKELTTSSQFTTLHRILSDDRSTTRLKHSASYLLLTLVSNNSKL